MCSRKALPAEMISRNNFSVWSILKKCIGMVSLTCFLTRIGKPKNTLQNIEMKIYRAVSDYFFSLHNFMFQLQNQSQLTIIDFKMASL